MQTGNIEDSGSDASQKIINITLLLGSLVGIYLTSRYSYLLFHGLAEMYSILVAFGMFMITWNSRRFLENNYILLLGTAYLAIGGLDLFHTLAYKGMGVFGEDSADLPTQLWIAARYLESISLLVAPFMLARKNLKAGYLVYGYLAVSALILASIFYWDIFPRCYIEGAGLTRFKIVSEYAICLILVGAALLLYRRRESFEPRVFNLLVASIGLTIGAELAFTFYISVYGLSNLIGHYLKIVSFYLIYKAIIETGLTRPYELLFRNLKQSEADLRTERDNLQKALAEIKTLQGILPICSYCKKIRNDRGDWTKLEQYLAEYSEAKLSHGICPECMETHFPKLAKKFKAD